MYLPAHQLTGYAVTAEFYTECAFRKMMKADPSITLDEAILHFEKAPTHLSLAEFARDKGRKADGYRASFGSIFAAAKTAK